MQDAFSFYERGMRRLLEQLIHNEAAYRNALLLQLRLEGNIADARTHGTEPTQKNELNKILEVLNAISMQNTKRSFHTWCVMYPLVEQSDLPEEIQSIERYLGRLSAFYSGNVHWELTDQLIEMGARPKAGKEAPPEDILERYTSVPLHAVFLYTSQDEIMSPYILNNWGTLDTLSGDICDIHPVLDQFNNVEDAYDYIAKLDVITEVRFRAYSKLPGIFFWDQAGCTEYISFGPETTASRITYILRVVFEHLEITPEIASVTHAKNLL
jgi:hypothetical protein